MRKSFVKFSELQNILSKLTNLSAFLAYLKKSVEKLSCDKITLKGGESVVFSFVNMKGGTGKTTLAYMTALGLAREKKVLVIDTDPQANLTTALIENPHNIKNHIGLIFEKRKLDSKTAQSLVHKTVFERVFIVPSHIKLSKLENEIHSPDWNLRLRKLSKYLTKDFDVIIIDCPPNLGKFTINAILSSNFAIIPITPDVFAIEGLNIITDFILEATSINQDFVDWFIIPSLIDTRLKLHKSFIELLNNSFKERLFTRFIPRRSDIHRTVNFKKDPFSTRETSAKTRQLLNEYLEEFKKKVKV